MSDFFFNWVLLDFVLLLDKLSNYLFRLLFKPADSHFT